jgi:hypothetical protein
MGFKNDNVRTLGSPCELPFPGITAPQVWEGGWTLWQVFITSVLVQALSPTWDLAGLWERIFNFYSIGWKESSYIIVKASNNLTYKNVFQFNIIEHSNVYILQLFVFKHLVTGLVRAFTFHFFFSVLTSRGSSVGIGTGYGMEDRESDFESR